MKKKEFEQLKASAKAAREVVDKADRLKTAWWWGENSGNASARSSRARWLSGNAAWTEGGHEWRASVEVSMSRAHTYVSTDYRKDGVKTNLKAVRNSCLRMETAVVEETARRAAREARKAAKLAAQATKTFSVATAWANETA